MSEERKIQIRFRPEQFDEAAVLRDYELRSAHLGRKDHDYVRRLVLIGHKLDSIVVLENNDKTGRLFALSTNESNNTFKEQSDLSINGSHPSQSQEKDVGAAIRNLSSVFGTR